VYTQPLSSLGLDLIHTDEAITPAGVKDVTGTRLTPSQTEASNGVLLVQVVRRKRLGGDLLNNLLLRQVKDDDTIVGTNDQPEELLGEEDAVDGRLAVLLHEVSSTNHVPNHNVTIVGTGSKVRVTNNHVKSGDLRLVTGEGVDKLHVGKSVPNLDRSIPGSRHAHSGLSLVIEFDAGDRLGVSVVLNSVSAFRSGVPNLDARVSGTGHDHVVAGGDSNGEHVSRVSNELAEGFSSLNIPQTDSTIPRGREAELAVSGQANLFNKVRVACVHLARLAPFLLFISVLLGFEIPSDHGLITRGRHKVFFIFAIEFAFADNERGDPTTVTLEESSVSKNV